MTISRRILMTGMALVALSLGAHATSLKEAMADPKRPADQVAQDSLRKPAETIAFAGIKPGQQVADFLPGGGYFTRLFSDVAGPSGHVTMLETTRWGADNIASDQKVIDDGYKNVSLDTAPFGQFQLAPVRPLQPVEELDRVAHRRGEEHEADVLRQQVEGQFPDDAALRVREAVEFVHHHGRDVLEAEAFRMQQAVE